MNILFITSSYLPNIGGVERHLACLVALLHNIGCSINIVTRTTDKKSISPEYMKDCAVYRFIERHIKYIPYSRAILVWFWFWKHRDLIRQADIIHCHDYVPFWRWYIPYRFLFYRKPVYITFHGYEGRFPVERTAIIKRKIVGLLTKGNICIGDFISRWYGTKPDYISYGFTILTESTPIDYTKPRLVFIGRLADDTGASMILDCIDILKDKYGLSLPADFCGDGPLRDQLISLCQKLGLSVNFHGFVSKTSDYIKKSSIVAATGYLSILDAMIAKRPVFAIYNNPLKKDYLISIGKDLIDITNSSEDMAKNIYNYYIEPKLWEEKIERAFQFAKQQNQQNLLNLYIKLWSKSPEIKEIITKQHPVLAECLSA